MSVSFGQRGNGATPQTAAPHPKWLGAVFTALVSAALSACGDDGPSMTVATSGAGAGGGSGAGGSSGGGGNSVGAGGALPEVFTVAGLVTDGRAPLEGAIVMQGGGQPAFETGPDGTFSIELTQSIAGIPTVIAAKTGYRSAGEEIFALPATPLELVLYEIGAPDNETYEFGHPGWGSAETDISTAYCGHCHTTLAAQFQTSLHAQSAKDPWVQDLFAGVASSAGDAASCASAGGVWRTGTAPGMPGQSTDRCYVGSGVLPDLNAGCGGPSELACDDPSGTPPTVFGACADCHAAGMDGPAGGRNLLDAEGIGYEFGNHCDACHHVRDIDLTGPPGTAGRLIMQRPSEKLSGQVGAGVRQAMFGPLPDVPNAFMGGSYQPKFKEAVFCSGCHEQKQDALLPGMALDPARWPDGLPTHSTFSEWQDSPFQSAGVPCQGCHMPPTEGLFNTVDVSTAADAGITFGFARPPEDIRSHIFRGPLQGMPRLIDSALTMSVDPQQTGSTLDLEITIANVGAGHAIPTGEPLRALHLVVSAQGCGDPLPPSGGMTVLDVGGHRAQGTVGTEVTSAGAMLIWTDGASSASVGDVVRAVRPTGTFDDYPGIGFFASPALTAPEKGIERRTPVGEATVVSVEADTLTLDGALATAAGDIVFLGDPLGQPLADGSPAGAYAGAAGHSFARVVVDPNGRRMAPHYRGVDLVSDNRLPPGAAATTQHAFTVPPGCTDLEIRAQLLYRRAPLWLADERGWSVQDFVVASAKASVP